MINILTKAFDFEIAKFTRKYQTVITNKSIEFLHVSVVNKYCIFKDQTQVYYFSGNQQLHLYIPFIEITNLLKNLLTLRKLDLSKDGFSK